MGDRKRGDATEHEGGHKDGWRALFQRGVSIRLREPAHHKIDSRTEHNRSPRFKNPGHPAVPPRMVAQSKLQFWSNG